MTGSGDPAEVTEEAVRHRKQEIEALLMEGLQSGPATPMTSPLWGALRQRVRERLGKHAAK